MDSPLPPKRDLDLSGDLPPLAADLAGLAVDSGDSTDEDKEQPDLLKVGSFGLVGPFSTEPLAPAYSALKQAKNG